MIQIEGLAVLAMTSRSDGMQVRRWMCAVCDKKDDSVVIVSIVVK